MKPRTLLVRTQGVLLLVLGPALTWGIDRKSELYLINTRPPSVALVDAAEWKVQGSVPLAPEPTCALTGPANRRRAWGESG